SFSYSRCGCDSHSPTSFSYFRCGCDFHSPTAFSYSSGGCDSYSPTVQSPLPVLNSRTVVTSLVQVQDEGKTTEQSLALRSGHFLHQEYPQPSLQQATNAKPAEDEEDSTSTYDLLRHLKQMPAMVFILELLKKYKMHQEAL